MTLKTYLFMLGRSRALNALKHRKIIRFTPLSEASQTPDGDGTDMPEALLLADERRRALSDALETLPPDMRAAVHLVYLEEMTYEQAAKIMHKNKKQVDNLLYRAKKELYLLLGKDSFLS